MFNAEKVVNEIIEDMRNYANKRGIPGKAVIGISGGKDSSVVAALSVLAFGKENVIGVMMPNGEQSDINDSIEILNFLEIPLENRLTINIGDAYNGLTKEIKKGVDNINSLSKDEKKFDVCLGYTSNTPARLRMTTLYGISSIFGGIVMNTCNRSEDVLGYSTFYGDSAGSYAPLSHLTVTEVRAIGTYLKLPKHLVMKTPSDGMVGSSDEDRLSLLLGIKDFTYERLDKYIRREQHDFTAEEVKSIITMFEKMKFKIQIIQIPCYDPKLPDAFEYLV